MEEKPEELYTEFDDNNNSNDNNDDISVGDSTYDLRYDDGDDGDDYVIAPQRYDDSPPTTQPEAVPKPRTQEQQIQYDTTRSQPSSQRKTPSVYPKMHFGNFQIFKFLGYYLIEQKRVILLHILFSFFNIANNCH